MRERSVRGRRLRQLHLLITHDAFYNPSGGKQDSIGYLLLRLRHH